MRPSGDWEAEAWVLTTEQGRSLLDRTAAVPRPLPADLARWRKTDDARHVAAAVRLAEGRRRGAAKFSRADRMWFDPTGLEQSTTEPVALHKARRFVGPVVVDLCAGIGGDTIAMARNAEIVLAINSDEGMCRRTQWNAEVHDAGDRVASIRSLAESFPLPPGALVHIDPDRRARSTRQARSLGDYAPNLEFLHSLSRSAIGGALKVSPASDFEDHFDPRRVEIELVSLGGECKEATIWFGGLTSCRRRATVLPEGATWTDRDAPAGRVADASAALAWVFDPDPSLTRAGLLDSFAAAHKLVRLGPAIDLLTADNRVDSPFLSSFEVEDVIPLDMKQLRRLVAEREIGTLEIKPRALDLTPESLRARLKPRGPNVATLLLVGGAGPARAILAHRR